MHALREFYRSYEMLRTQRHHPGPALKGMRLYRATWTLKSDAGNAALTPDVRELLLDTTDPRGAARPVTTAATTQPSTSDDPDGDDEPEATQ